MVKHARPRGEAYECPNPSCQRKFTKLKAFRGHGCPEAREARLTGAVVVKARLK